MILIFAKSCYNMASDTEMSKYMRVLMCEGVVIPRIPHIPQKNSTDNGGIYYYFILWNLWFLWITVF